MGRSPGKRSLFGRLDQAVENRSALNGGQLIGITDENQFGLVTQSGAVWPSKEGQPWMPRPPRSSRAEADCLCFCELQIRSSIQAIDAKWSAPNPKVRSGLNRASRAILPSRVRTPSFGKPPYQSVLPEQPAYRVRLQISGKDSHDGSCLACAGPPVRRRRSF